MSERLNFLYEDAVALVLDKPAGLPCTIEWGGKCPTVADLLVERYPELASVGKRDEHGLVHRLDNDTSGCLLVAKTAEAYAKFRAQFDARTIQKEYCALLVGSVPEQVTWNQPIAHHPRDKRRMTPFPKAPSHKGEGGHRGQRAVTIINRLTWFPASADHPTPYSLCRVTIPTGVRHQIRVHAAAAGFPLAGDGLYQTPHTRKLDRLPLQRHFLHAARIVFKHPITGATLTVECPIPKDLATILQSLEGTSPGL